MMASATRNSPARDTHRGGRRALFVPAQMTARRPSNNPKWRYRRRPKHTSGRGLFLFGGVWFLPLGRSWARGCALWLRVNRGGIPRVLSTPAGGTSSLRCHSPATRGHPSPTSQLVLTRITGSLAPSPIPRLSTGGRENMRLCNATGDARGLIQPRCM